MRCYDYACVFFVVAQCVAQHNKVHVQLNVRERDGMKNMNIFYCVMNHGYVREAWFTWEHNVCMPSEIFCFQNATNLFGMCPTVIY